MAKSSTVTLSANVALSLDPFELGVYTKGKALLANGRRAFSISDVGGDKDLAREAVRRLLDLKLVTHNGGGWYSLARVPSQLGLLVDLGTKMASAAVAKTSQSQGAYERLRDCLKSLAKKTYGHSLPASMYAVSNRVNKARYGRITKVVRDVDATVEEFAEFVFGMDWSWMSEGYPGVGLLCTDDFLNKFRWFMEHQDEITQADQILTIYDSVFHYEGIHKYEDRLAVLQLRAVLSERGITPESFFGYASSLKWRSFGGLPTIKFLTSSRFVGQAQSVLPGRGGRSFVRVSETYLGRIVDRLSRVELPLSAEDFEDRNWEIGEAVFEPLAALVSDFGSQLGSLVRKVTDEKDSPSLGFYVTTYDGKLTPLAVYWIVYASNRLDSFCSAEVSSWKDLVRELAAEAVNLSVLEKK